MSHTPGPWLRDGATVYAVNEGGSNRMSFNMQGGWLFGYRHSVDDFRTPHEELLANAHLIAAAPELLSALKLCASRLEMDRQELLLLNADNPNDVQNEAADEADRAAVALANAAIAKAEAPQP